MIRFSAKRLKHRLTRGFCKKLPIGIPLVDCYRLSISIMQCWQTIENEATVQNFSSRATSSPWASRRTLVPRSLAFACEAPLFAENCLGKNWERT